MTSTSKNKRSIMARFIVEKGRWNKHSNDFLERTTSEFEREIEMEIFLKDGEPILKFIGGPTGFESYYVKDLDMSDRPLTGVAFCICGGTINRWPRCEVSAAEVADFLKTLGTKSNPCRDKIVPKSQPNKDCNHSTKPECNGCSHARLQDDDGYCYMFKEQPQYLPCFQHDKFRNLRKEFYKNPLFLGALLLVCTPEFISIAVKTLGIKSSCRPNNCPQISTEQGL